MKYSTSAKSGTKRLGRRLADVGTAYGILPASPASENGATYKSTGNNIRVFEVKAKRKFMRVTGLCFKQEKLLKTILSYYSLVILLNLVFVFFV